jgi:hypothetical protein
MEYDLSRMDPLYRILQKDSYEEGFEEGRQEVVRVLQQAAIDVVAKRFPGLKEHAQKSIARVNDLEHLEELIPEISVLSQEEVDEVLDQLYKQQSQKETDL